MHRRFFSDQEDPEPEPESEPILENGPGTPSSGDDSKMSGAPSPKKRKGAEKRVVSVPIGGSKGDAHPPSDSWAWRKYGQKPIKGSPYPRGYYRCSSSKGCPARKQVERSRVDPSLLLITYASDHNHPLPATKHHHHHSATTFAASVPATPPKFPPEELAVFANQTDLELGDGSLLASEFGWFADDVASTNVLDSPICCCTDDADVEMMFSAREDEESLFADLGELPECSVVFRRSVVDSEGENRRCSLSTVVPCCGSTG